MKKLAILTLFLLPLLTACNNTPIPAFVGYSDDWQPLSNQSGPGLVADPTSPIPDVMVPIGFKPIPARCTATSDGLYRTVSHTYQGKANVAELIQYFQTHLTDANWEMVNRMDDLATRSLILNWTKGPEDLRITLSKRVGIATITIYIQPRSAGSMMSQSPTQYLPQPVQITQ
ncbi:hypothetical protein KS4_15910 [Poriferisphaera corsica]|uniref:Lipoprotein n=1 Tax=Poriferisphaera corsica TaxID=2528020 RepID=A0A517YTI9_9BACT|nr:hypothetical protein [Poriferisphaera corsica]QDU33541.1 hypothetical protein KS4_15910 [Poriferisphaera corsica]